MACLARGDFDRAAMVARLAPAYAALLRQLAQRGVPEVQVWAPAQGSLGTRCAAASVVLFGGLCWGWARLVVLAGRVAGTHPAQAVSVSFVLPSLLPQACMLTVSSHGHTHTRTHAHMQACMHCFPGTVVFG